MFIKCLPNPFEMKKLRALKEQNVKLADAEEFLASFCDIDDLIHLIYIFSFKMREQLILHYKRYSTH